MRALVLLLTVAAVVAACDGDSKKTATPAASTATGVALPTYPAAGTATVPTTPAIAACPTPPPGPPSAVTYQAASTAQGQGVLTGVVVATTACSDAATFTFAGSGVPGYTIKYVQATSACGSGQPVITAGAAQLCLRLEPAVAHDNSGNVTVSPLSFAPNDPSIKELKSTCDFEGVVAWAIGTEERYYTVTVALSPSRIVVNVYH